MATTSQNPSPPHLQRLGGFEILEKIGEGGMGAVYRAQQVSLERAVALKVLSPKLAADPKYTDSFLREARSAARLQHANIVAVFDAGKADEYYYYAMEFIHGESLQKWVARDGALPEPLALDVTLCVADALRHAWNTEQLIHRDIKPDNILIDTHGNVKLCDLGLAKYFGETTLMSLSGQVFGTPQYMSPEQARAEKVDCRTDIYSLGLTLYYALTAQIPFHGGTHGMVMARHMTEQLPDPRDFAPATSVHTVRIIEKMVSKNAAQRYDNWDEVLRDLRLAKEGKPPQIPLIFHGISSVKRNGVLPMEGRAPSRPQPAEVVTWEKPAPQPRVKQPVEGHPAAAGSRPPSHLLPDNGRDGARPSKNRAPLFISVGIGLLLLLGVSTFFALSSQNPKPKTQNPSVPPSAKPPDTVVNPRPPPVVQPSTLSREQAAANLLAQAHQFAVRNPDDHAGQLRYYSDIVANYSGTPSATEAEKMLNEIRARHAAAIAEQERLRQQQEIARLLRIAKENDFKDNRGKNIALPALAQLLALDPNHAEAKALQAKISGYYDANFTNTIGMEMVWLPAPAGYYVGKYEVTQAEYEKVMKNNPSNFKDPRKPVEMVSWNDAMEFCKRLTEIERAAGRLKEGWVYTLPTEKQWEYFVGNADLKDSVTSEKNRRNSTERVGSLGANNFGLYDVRGNVWEWCENLYSPSGSSRVLRGASWRDYNPGPLAVSARGSSDPSIRNINFGFRCVLVAVGAASSSVEPAQTGQQTTVKPDSSAKAPSADKPWENSLGMKFVPVQGTNALFSIWETRVQDYEAFAKATGRQWEKPNFNQEPTHPAVNVSWDDAKAFCKWLTDKERREGRLTAQQEYRLPTETEWNVAVGTTKYPWGDEWPPPKGAGNYADSLKVDDFPNTSPVGSFKANRFGLFDMGGNVWEWCEDLYQSGSSSRVLRGASWDISSPVILAVSYRISRDPSIRIFNFGFRVVLVAR